LAPFVFTSGDDPVRTGLVSSINRPGGNVTGVFLVVSRVLTKRLDMMHELLPKAHVMATLLNPNSSLYDVDREEVTAAARSLRIEMHVLAAAGAASVSTRLWSTSFAAISASSTCCVRMLWFSCIKVAISARASASRAWQ